MRRLLVNLWQGARLAALRRPRPQAGLGQLLALLVLGWGCALVGDWQQAPTAVGLAPFGFAAAAARGYLWLAALALIAMSERTRPGFLPLAVALAAADVVMWLVWLTVIALWPRYGPQSFAAVQDSLWLVMVAWQVAILLPALAAVSGRLAPRHLAHAALYAGVLYLGDQWLPDYPLLEAAPEKSLAQIDVEAVYYRQPELLARALREVSAGVPGRRELFVVTFAGFGEEDVFKREALQVARIVGRRFDAARRELRLINNRATLKTHPLANRSNLALALRAIARKMQPDEDILFLFLTSHGSSDGEFAVELGELGLNDLRPQELRAVLDEAGIRWRVVVVSACYSGRFIEALAEPQTLLMTAAARDRTSFGCAHENTWTYFGEAYFRHALTHTHSFAAAFARAERLIAAREQREGKEPSRPQMRMGEAVAPVLREFSARFGGASEAVTP